MDKLDDANTVIALCNLDIRRLTRENEMLKRSIHKRMITVYGTLLKTGITIVTDVIPIKGDSIWINEEHYVVKYRNIIYNEENDDTEIDIVVDLYEY